MTLMELREGYERIPPKHPSFHASAALSSTSNLGSPLNPSGENAVVAAFFLLGIGALLPWNALLSALDFYALLFPTLSVAQFITNAYTFPFMLAGIALSASPALSRYRRFIVFSGFAVFTLLPAALPALITRDDPLSSNADALTSMELWLTVGTAAIIGAVGSLVQSTLYGTITLFPGGRVTTAFSAGGGVASVFIVALRVVFRLVVDGNSRDGSVRALHPGFEGFLWACSVLCALCVLVFVWLDRVSHYYAHHVPGRYGLGEGRTEAGEVGGEVHSARKAWQEVFVPAACVLASFIVTLTLFPGILVQIPVPLREGIGERWRSLYPLGVVSLFAVGDTVGRSVPTEEAVVDRPNRLPVLTALRMTAVPIYLMQWLGVLPVNWMVVGLMVVGLGMANGLILTMAFLAVPGLAAPSRREVAGRVMFVTLITGISIGNVLGWVVEAGMRGGSDF